MNDPNDFTATSPPTAPLADARPAEARDAPPRRSRMGAEPTICVAFTKAVLAELSARGLEAEGADALALEASAAEDPNARVSLGRHARLFAGAVALADDPLFALNVGHRLPSSAFHTAALAAEFAADLGDAFDLLARYALLVSEGLDLTVDAGEEVDALGLAVTDARVVTPGPTLLALAAFLLDFVRRATGEPPRLQCISLPFPAPPRAGELATALGGPRLTFDASHLRIEFAKDHFRMPLLHANASLRSELEELSLRALNRAAPSVVVARTRASIARLQHLGSTSIDEVAKDLGMSSRTLQRHLKYAAATFSGLRDAACGDIARDLLRDRSRSVDEVGAELGFSSRSAFHRAFLRWTGKTPAEYRSAT